MHAMCSVASRYKASYQGLAPDRKNRYCYPGKAEYFDNPFQLLVATILSARCTDERVNMVTPALFAKYPTPADLAEARQDEVIEIIRSTGFFRNKSTNLISCSRDLVRLHEGTVPRRLDELVKLKGVGRKTANVVMGNAFGIPGGVPGPETGLSGLPHP